MIRTTLAPSRSIQTASAARTAVAGTRIRCCSGSSSNRTRHWRLPSASRILPKCRHTRPDIAAAASTSSLLTSASGKVGSAHSLGCCRCIETAESPDREGLESARARKSTAQTRPTASAAGFFRRERAGRCILRALSDGSVRRASSRAVGRRTENCQPSTRSNDAGAGSGQRRREVAVSSVVTVCEFSVQDRRSPSSQEKMKFSDSVPASEISRHKTIIHTYIHTCISYVRKPRRRTTL